MILDNKLSPVFTVGLLVFAGCCNLGVPDFAAEIDALLHA